MAGLDCVHAIFACLSDGVPKECSLVDFYGVVVVLPISLLAGYLIAIGLALVACGTTRHGRGEMNDSGRG